MDFKSYWTKDQGQNITAGPTDCPEGFDVVEFTRELLAAAPDIKVVHDIGCGRGRLCSVRDPEEYIGTDLNPGAISQAKQANPGYTFKEVRVDSQYPDADVTLAYTVFLHMDDTTLDHVLYNIRQADHPYVCVAEILGREWRRRGTPPVFNRDLTDYVEIMRSHGYYLYAADSKVYQHYKAHAPHKNVRLFGLLFKTFESDE